MLLPEPIPFLPMRLSESNRLTVLKSRYNWYAARLNRTHLSKWGTEERELLVQLMYLKEQIDQYEYP